MQNIVRSITTLVLVAALFMARPIAAAEPSFTDVLMGKAAPLTMTAKELTREWLCLSVSTNAGPSLETMMQMDGPEDLARLSTASLCYTQGKTVVVGAESFLIAYQPPKPKIKQPENADGEVVVEEDGAEAAAEPGEEPGVEEFLAGRLRPETVLSLALLNLRDVNMMSNIRFFDPAKDMVTAEQLRAAEEQLKRTGNARSVKNLRQIGLAIMMYCQDHDEMMPDKDTVWQDINLDKGATVHPVTKEHYVYNAALSNEALGKIDDPVQTVLVYEATPAEDGTRGICFVDGHVTRVKDAEWEKIKKANKMP